MRICSWNINGLRSLPQPLRIVLDQLNCDIICVQETKVTRRALAEEYARIDGYHTFYSWSRLREGYSGVAIFCKTHLTPTRAEEGLAGKLNPSMVEDCLGGEYPSFDELDLLAIDREGRAIMTEHELDDGSRLVVINVYCPRVDKDKSERLEYKLKFFAAIEQRARQFLQHGSRVIIVGDFNVSHQPIDTCDPGEDLNYFTSSPSRLWFSNFLADDIFIDTFRLLHPDEREAYTCWNTVTGARVNNYGVRIDYILCDGRVSKAQLVNCQHRTDIGSSDHCPVMAEFNFTFQNRSQARPPSICTKFWPEFKGIQMKLSQFVMPTKRIRDEETLSTFPEQKNQKQDESSSPIVTQRPSTVQTKSRGQPALKKVKSEQSSLLVHFKRNSPSTMTPPTAKEIEVVSSPAVVQIDEKPKPTTSWSQIFRPPTPPPLCSGHQERCVIRQVKDRSSINWGRYFYVCSRANGAADNPQARCDHFEWKKKMSSTTTK